MKTEREKIIDCGKAVMFLVVCKDEVLLQERPFNERGFAGETIIPGGKNDPGESHFEAAVRELREETGLDEVNITSLGDAFKAITTNAHLYSIRAYMVEIDDKDDVVDIEPNKGKFIWKSFKQAKNNVKWAHSQLVFERAEKLLRGEWIGG